MTGKLGLCLQGVHQLLSEKTQLSNFLIKQSKLTQFGKNSIKGNSFSIRQRVQGYSLAEVFKPSLWVDGKVRKVGLSYIDINQNNPSQNMMEQLKSLSQN